ncbi:MAG: HAAS signaling domain-containing protein [Acidimicrobiia bacterium]
MSITLSATKAHYLAGVRAELADLAAEDLDDVVVDLEAHLAEIEDDRIESELGTPVTFAAEFRHSAGLDIPGSRRWTGAPLRARRWIERMGKSPIWSDFAARWRAFRPTWIWIRGWLLVAILAGLIEATPFRNFPIPEVSGQPILGIVAVAAATWLSHWLEPSSHGSWRAGASALLSAATGLALFVSLTVPVSLTRQSQLEVFDPASYIDRLTAGDGTHVTNIYAFDLDGNPLEVLLFDQDGRPLRSLPDHVYEEAEFHPGESAIPVEAGAVRLQRDSFGRVIPNLYPLEMLRYDDRGQLTDAPPPSPGFPGSGVDGSSATQPNDFSATKTTLR